MLRLPRNCSLVCEVAGCTNLATGRHHCSYFGPPEWQELCQRPICTGHHGALTWLWRLMSIYNVKIEAFTAVYFIDPVGVTRFVLEEYEPSGVWIRKLTRETSVRQLDLGDLHGPEGDYWRRWLAEDNKRMWQQEQALRDQGSSTASPPTNPTRKAA